MLVLLNSASELVEEIGSNAERVLGEIKEIGCNFKSGTQKSQGNC